MSNIEKRNSCLSWKKATAFFGGIATVAFFSYLMGGKGEYHVKTSQIRKGPKIIFISPKDVVSDFNKDGVDDVVEIQTVSSLRQDFIVAISKQPKGFKEVVREPIGGAKKIKVEVEDFDLDGSTDIRLTTSARSPDDLFGEVSTTKYMNRGDGTFTKFDDVLTSGRDMKRFEESFFPKTQKNFREL